MTQTDRAAGGAPFRVDVARLDGKVTVSPRGDLDLATSERFGNALASLIQPGNHIVVDCRLLSFVDSTGIGVLVRTRNSCKQVGATLELQSVPMGPRRALELGGVAGLLGLDHAPGDPASHDEPEHG